MYSSTSTGSDDILIWIFFPTSIFYWWVLVDNINYLNIFLQVHHNQLSFFISEPWKAEDASQNDGDSGLDPHPGVRLPPGHHLEGPQAPHQGFPPVHHCGLLCKSLLASWFGKFNRNVIGWPHTWSVVQHLPYHLQLRDLLCSPHPHHHQLLHDIHHSRKVCFQNNYLNTKTN